MPCVYYKYVIGLEDLPVKLGCVAMIAEEISITSDFFFSSWTAEAVVTHHQLVN